MTILFILASLFIGIAFFYHYSTTPVNPAPVTSIVGIPKGSGFIRITEILSEAGLVSNRPFFWILAFGKQAAAHIRAGEYELSSAMSPSQIIDKLVRGEIKSYPVTLPEDITVKDVVERLSAFNLINEQEFMTLATDKGFLASCDIESDSIEGYLYPNTYKFDRSMTTKEVVRTLVKEFWKKVTPELRKRAEEMGLTITEWVTLASIIGKESGNNEEKPLISAVFHNRLALGMKLQSDPTAVYHLVNGNDAVKKIQRKHLLTVTPHNTYQIKGLPPGPIANPGIDSLRAALYPAKVDYLYFVAKNDGTHHFSASIEAHNRAVLKYQINRQKK